MKTEIYPYQAGTLACKGYFAYADETKTKPLILIAPTWEGVNVFAKNIAHELVEHGYAAFVADLYGAGKVPSSRDEAASLMTPLFLDRPLLHERINAAYQAAKPLRAKIGAIGFCFGGLTVIELLKSGAALSAIVSIHGTLSDTIFGKKAVLAPLAAKIQSPVLILHGYKDPFVPMSDLLKLQQMLDQANVDWQTYTFGNAAHSFTNPDASDVPGGMYYEPLACRRSKTALYNFLQEKFSK